MSTHEITTITLHQRAANGMLRVELWHFPEDVLIKFKSLMLNQSNYFWRRFLVDHPVAARYREAKTTQPLFISPQSIYPSNPRFIHNDSHFEGFVELFPNTEIFIDSQDFQRINSIMNKVSNVLSKPAGNGAIFSKADSAESQA